MNIKEEDFCPNYAHEFGIRSCRERKKRRRREKRKKKVVEAGIRLEGAQKIGTRRKKGNKQQKNKIREGLIWRERRQKFSPSKGQVSF